MIKIAIVAIARDVKALAWMLCVAALLGMSTHARDVAAADRDGAAAEEAVSIAAPPAVTMTRWYGWQTLLGELPALAAFASSGATDNRSLSTFGFTSLVLYFTVAPSVHIAHRRPASRSRTSRSVSALLSSVPSSACSWRRCS